MAVKRPESVLVVVHAGSEVLVLRRSAPADFWQSVTGSMRWDEQRPEQAARRELLEETGLEVPVQDCRCTNRFPILPAWRGRYGTALENVEHVFRAELPRARPVRLNLAEHVEQAWLPREAAAARVSSWTNRDAILAFVPPRPAGPAGPAEGSEA